MVTEAEAMEVETKAGEARTAVAWAAETAEVGTLVRAVVTTEAEARKVAEMEATTAAVAKAGEKVGPRAAARVAAKVVAAMGGGRVAVAGETAG